MAEVERQRPPRPGSRGAGRGSFQAGTVARRHAVAADAAEVSHRTQLAPLSLIASLGLIVVSGALVLSRHEPNSTRVEVMFWLGLVTIVIPFAFRLGGRSASRNERIGSALVVGLLLYLVKVVHDPYTFTFGDEWIHEYNVGAILHSGSLFQPNPILPVTSRYPGLETVTAGVALLTGLSTFASGLIVVGVGRLVVVLALFLLIERVTASSRVAGLAVLVYAGNPNFVFWSAQFSYESLALPLVVVVLLLVSTKAEAADSRDRVAWTVAAVVVTSAIVVTHHISSFVLCGTLLAACLIFVLRRRGRSRAPWVEVAFALAATSLWALKVAPVTANYLSPVIGNAFHDTIHAIAGTTNTRAPFQPGTPSQQSASAAQRGIAILSVALVALGIPFGAREAWRRHRSNPYVLLLALSAIAYIVILPMRLVPAAWETSNRASEFLFVGGSAMLGLVAMQAWDRWRPFRFVLPLCVSVVLVGGLVAGWPPRVLLAHPYEVNAGGRVLRPPDEAAAEWSLTVAGRGNRVVAPEALGRVLLAHGDQTAYIGHSPFDTHDLLFAQTVTPAMVRELAANHIRYVAVDRRKVGDDSMLGYFFTPAGGVPLFSEATAKWDAYSGVDRVFDNGAITVYDVRRLWNAASG